MAAEGKGPARFAIEVLEDGVDAASFRAAIGASGGGGGDVTGPASAVDDRIVTFDGTTGKLIQDSGTLISDLAPASHAHASTAITDFTEAAQDAVGAMVDSSLVYTDGTPLLQRAALTGDVTASAGDNATTIANDAVSYAKMQNVSAASKLLGRGDSGAGDVQEITLGSGLTMTGTTLSASGGPGGSAAWTEYEVDFGTTPTWDATFTVTDAGVSTTTEVAVVQSGKTATGQGDGDALWDAITYAAVPGTGSFTLYAIATPGPVMGKRYILYQVGT